MKCPNCNQEMIEKKDFCINCGKRLIKEKQVSKKRDNCIYDFNGNCWFYYLLSYY